MILLNIEIPCDKYILYSKLLGDDPCKHGYI